MDCGDEVYEGTGSGLRRQLTIFPRHWQEKSPRQKKSGITAKVWYHYAKSRPFSPDLLKQRHPTRGCDD
jgi:hypothetical protein